MRLKTLFNKFDQFADAPNAVAKMRELIVDLAVAGALVENCPEEAPVDLRALEENDTHPTNWRFGSLGHVLNFEYGKNLPAKKRSESGEYPVYGSNGVVGTHNSYITKRSAIIIGRKGSAGALNISDEPSWTTDVAYYTVPPASVDLRFAFYLLSSLRLSQLGKGIKPGLNRKEVYALSVGLPPLAEQKRIVAKLDELMTLCDRLEAQQQERDTRHAVLARASLAHFADAPTPANLQFLLHESYDIDPADLRKSILTLAIRGKLVPQSPNDDTALTLLAQIAAHKVALAKEGMLRGSTAVNPMSNGEGEFEIPGKWSWVRFGEIMINRDGERIPVSREQREGKEKIYDYYGASGVIDKIDGYLFDKPLLLIGEDGANLVNRATPIAFIARGKYWVNNHAHVLDGISESFLQFIELHINAINLEKYVTGSAQPKMNQAKMNSIPIALPPLAEQRRIVAKVNELMVLVDELEMQLAESRATAKNLLEALVAELTAAGASSHAVLA